MSSMISHLWPVPLASPFHLRARTARHQGTCLPAKRAGRQFAPSLSQLRLPIPSQLGQTW